MVDEIGYLKHEFILKSKTKGVHHEHLDRIREWINAVVIFSN